MVRSAQIHEPDAGQAAPIQPHAVAMMVESVVGCKWSLSLLELCTSGTHRPSEFLRACSGLSAKVMNERLRKLTGFGILSRTVHGERPPIHVEYHLTAFGRRFVDVIHAIRKLQADVDAERLR